MKSIRTRFWRVISRNRSRQAQLTAFFLDTFLPASVVGPVDCCHGFQVWINLACRAFCSAVQRLAGMLHLKYQIVRLAALAQLRARAYAHTRGKLWVSVRSTLHSRFPASAAQGFYAPYALPGPLSTRTGLQSLNFMEA